MPKNKSNGRSGIIKQPKQPLSPAFRQAMKSTVAALQRIAKYKLERPIARLMSEMGERKEFLNEKEHEQLLALVEFSERRSIEKLAAQVALKQLREALPEVIRDS